MVCDMAIDGANPMAFHRANGNRMSAGGPIVTGHWRQPQRMLGELKPAAVWTGQDPDVSRQLLDTRPGDYAAWSPR